jgi:hypothetical protein
MLTQKHKRITRERDEEQRTGQGGEGTRSRTGTKKVAEMERDSLGKSLFTMC